MPAKGVDWLNRFGSIGIGLGLLEVLRLRAGCFWIESVGPLAQFTSPRRERSICAANRVRGRCLNEKSPRPLQAIAESALPSRRIVLPAVPEGTSVFLRRFWPAQRISLSRLAAGCSKQRHLLFCLDTFSCRDHPKRLCHADYCEKTRRLGNWISWPQILIKVRGGSIAPFWNVRVLSG
jgi:hypothetical protein